MASFSPVSLGSTPIPKSITAMQGQIIGPPLGEIEIAAGDCLYLKATRTAAGDGVISGPVSIAGDVVSVSDGVNAAKLVTTGLTNIGDLAVIAIDSNASVFGVSLKGELYNDNIQISEYVLGKSHDLQGGNYAAYGGGNTLITGTYRVVTQSATNSGIQSQPAGYIPVVTGDVILVCADVEDESKTLKTITMQLAEMVSPFSSSSKTTVTTEKNFICCYHTATMTTNLRIRITSYSNTDSLPVNIKNITAIKISGRINDLVSLGDSICASSKDVGQSVNNDYTSVFCGKYRIPYINSGVGGETLTQIAARFDNTVKTPHTIILEGGANDIFQASADPTATMIAKMQEMIDKSTFLAKEVWVCTVPYCGSIAMPSLKNGWRVIYNSWLKTVDNITVIDLDVPLTDGSGNQIASYYSVDNTHPNTVGHAAIVEYMDSLGLQHKGRLIPIFSTATFDGTLPALTTEQKFALTRTVKSAGKPLTAGQVNKYVVDEVRYLTIPSGNFLELPSNE